MSEIPARQPEKPPEKPKPVETIQPVQPPGGTSARITETKKPEPRSAPTVNETGLLARSPSAVSTQREPTARATPGIAETGIVRRTEAGGELGASPGNQPNAATAGGWHRQETGAGPLELPNYAKPAATGPLKPGETHITLDPTMGHEKMRDLLPPPRTEFEDKAQGSGMDRIKDAGGAIVGYGRWESGIYEAYDIEGHGHTVTEKPLESPFLSPLDVIPFELVGSLAKTAAKVGAGYVERAVAGAMSKGIAVDGVKAGVNAAVKDAAAGTLGRAGGKDIAASAAKDVTAGGVRTGVKDAGTAEGGGIVLGVREGAASAAKEATTGGAKDVTVATAKDAAAGGAKDAARIGVKDAAAAEGKSGVKETAEQIAAANARPDAKFAAADDALKHALREGGPTVSADSLGTIGKTESTKYFRELVTKTINGNENHPLKDLLVEGRLLNPTVKGTNELAWLENPALVEAGHGASAHGALAGGGSEVGGLRLQSAYLNRFQSATTEHSSLGGIVLDNRALNIGGVPVDIMTARDLAAKGVLDPAFLRTAPVIRFNF